VVVLLLPTIAEEVESKEATLLLPANEELPANELLPANEVKVG